MTEFDPLKLVGEIQTQRLSKKELAAKLKQVSECLKETNYNIPDPDETENYLPLRKLGLVRSGYSSRAYQGRKEKQGEQSNILTVCQGIRINSIDKDSNTISLGTTQQYSVKNVSKYRIQSGDIIFPLRNRFDPILINNIPGNIIAVGEWLILTINETIMHKNFFLWYWHNCQTQERIEKEITRYSNSMRYLTHENLRDFKIDCPSLDVQSMILEKYQVDRMLEIKQKSDRTAFYDKLYQISRGTTTYGN